MAYISGIIRSRRGPWRDRVLTFAGLTALSVLPLAGQGYGHGTSAAVLMSRDAIVAAIDSKEVNRRYLSDGTTLNDERVSCKVRQTGPYYVLIAGISRATDGFDALQAAAGTYREGDKLQDFASRLATELPARLTRILDAVRAANSAGFDQAFREQDALQMSLLGTDEKGPRAIVVTFRASVSGSGQVTVEAHQAGCPGDCQVPDTIYLLGMHEEDGNFVHAHPEVTGDTSTSRALQLIGLEYASHPEVVGGPATVVRVSRAGAVLEQAGACTDAAGLPHLEDELDQAIAAVENVVVREDIAQYSKRGDGMRTGEIHASVRVVGGNEEYTWNGQGPRLPQPRLPQPPLPQPRLPQPRLPQPWCSGELATMLRATRQVLGRGRETLTVDATDASEPALVIRFHATTDERYWQLMVGSRIYPLAFDGEAWFSQATGKLLRLRWEATDLQLPSSAGIDRIEWDETFSSSEIAGQRFLTPSTAVYRVNYSRKADRTDWTETRFSDFRRFGATEDVRFEEAALR